ncbi:MAG TPA: hypothetical protein PKU96_06160 [bacterium]|nr:hypothetical protein [Myxococcales bacterium]HPW45934.1 hypothetical protein [bacterium]
MISMAHNWDSFLYQFIVGGIVLLAGIVIPIIKKDVKLSNRDDQLTIAAILGGTALFFLFYLAWQFYAIKGV